MTKSKGIKVFVTSIVILTMVPLSVYAGTQGYYSSLDMSRNSCHSGASRKYDKSKHNIEVTVTDKGPGDNKVRISEYYEGMWNTTLKSSKMAGLNSKGKTYKYYMGAFGAGDFFYEFDGRVETTGGPSTWYKSDNVYMYTTD